MGKPGPRELELRAMRENRVSELTLKRVKHRVPASFSDAEAEAMIERRSAEKKAKASERIARMKQALADKEQQQIDKANEKRQKMGLATIEPIESETTKEDVMAKAKKPKAAKAKSNGGKRAGNKSAKVVQFLTRPEGCTNKEVLKALGWPTISMPAMAKAQGLKLRKEKTEDGLRYYGTPK
jgi:uncharacterized protein DUF3489